MIIDRPYKDIPFIFKNNKDFRKLIRNQVFIVNNIDINAKYKITGLKYDERTIDLSVNIKISGNWKIYNYHIPKIDEVSLNSSYAKSRPRIRNKDIRSSVKHDLYNFFKMMGVSYSYIKINNIIIEDSI